MGDSQEFELKNLGNGIYAAPGARLVDRTGRKMLPMGRDGFEPVAKDFLYVDKTMLMADLLDSGYAVTLFCRPRRFGKSLNITMMRTFFELAPDGESRAALFEGTEVWEAKGGAYREHQGAYPVIRFSFNTVKKDTWEASYGEIKQLIQQEYARHGYLAQSSELDDLDKTYFKSVYASEASDVDYAASLIRLAKMLKKHHNRPVVILIDEYDAPVMAGYSAPDGGYYREVVSFLKGWLTGALKDGGEALAFAALTGVQRISKESIFSDLNNLRVDTALSGEFDERYGFSEPEVKALATYLGCPECIPEAKEWYDGYRFGSEDVYNPWSLINYLKQGCTPGLYWSNTSSNTVIGDLIRHADQEAFLQVCELLQPGGTVSAQLDLSIVFPDVGVRASALWSMLYLAGYLTTDLTAAPDDYGFVRPLRIPNKEVTRLYRNEVVLRFGSLAGGVDKLIPFREALAAGDERKVTAKLASVAMNSASSLDLVSENSVHMLMLGLCFGLPGYGDPRSNIEADYGCFDIRIDPVYVAPGTIEAYGARNERPRITIETKFVKAADAPEGEEALEALLEEKAREAIAQIERKAYDAGDLPEAAHGRIRWGVAFCGKHVLARCAWA